MTEGIHTQPVVVAGPGDDVATLRRRLAEYAMSMDVLSRLNVVNTEAAVVERLLDLMIDVCAPTVTGFSLPDGSVQVRPDTPDAREAVATAAGPRTRRHS